MTLSRVLAIHLICLSATLLFPSAVLVNRRECHCNDYSVPWEASERVFISLRPPELLLMQW